MPLPNRPSSQALRRGLLGLAAHLPSRGPSSRNPRRVLLIRPDHIGDVLLTSPAVGLLRESLPDPHLTYLVGPWSVAAARGGPPVDDVRTLAFPGFTRQPRANVVDPYLVLLRQAARLRAERYDLAVVFRPDHWWGALLATVAGIPLRVGTRQPETERLLTHARDAKPDRHAVQAALETARLALAVVGISPPLDPHTIVFRVSAAARDQARAMWVSLGLEATRAVAIQPGAGAALKSWPTARWARLADRLAACGLNVVLVGAPGERRLLEAIASQSQHTPPIVCGQTLEVSAAIYERCALLIAPDGGAAHLAGVVGVPTVRLYGPAPPGVFGPWPPRPRQRVLLADGLACTPCGHLERPPCGASFEPACMLAHGVDDVFESAWAVLNDG